MRQINVIGAGAWGTALAGVARRGGAAVRLWAHEREVARAIAEDHANPLYLPGVALDPAIEASHELAEMAAADALLFAVPAQFVREVARRLAPSLGRGVPVVICAKGIERGSLALMSEVLAETLPEAPLAVLSGPTFAAEVARGLPTAVTLAARDHTVGEALVDALGDSRFRPYLSDDLIGAEIGGAVKNVLAIACGIAHGKGLGDNARAALITRGLAEMTRLAAAKGGRAETLMGLSGVGDLLLTCTSEQSRNFSLGRALGAGTPLADILASRRSVAEGVFSAEAVTALAARHGVDMPLSAAVDAILNRNAAIEAQIGAVLARPFRSE